MGKSARIRSASSFFVVWTATDLSYPGALGLPPAAGDGLVRAVGAQLAAVAAAPVARAVDEDAAARMGLAAAEPREAVLADRLEQGERRRRGEELDPGALVGAVAEAPPTAGPLELRRPAVLREERVERRDGVLLGGGVEGLAQALPQVARAGNAGLVDRGRSRLVTVEAEVAAQPAWAQELRVGLELVPGVEEVDGERDPAAPA